MTRSHPAPGAERILEQLAGAIARLPGIEAAVFWEADGWSSEPAEVLETDEIVFYVEGLLDEGFHLEWRLLALTDAPATPDHLRLYVWEEGARPPESEGPMMAVLQAGGPV